MKFHGYIIFLILLIVGNQLLAEEKLREWSSSSGSKIKATLVEFSDGKVTLKRENGQKIEVLLSQLSPEDQNFLTAKSKPEPTTVVPDIEGNQIGVVVDISGSVAEWLPVALREIDLRFDDAPIVYIRNAMIRGEKESKVISVERKDVMATSPNGEGTPYWFLWHDLPRKSPQKTVDQLINIFQTRPNQFLAVGADSQLISAMFHLQKEGCDVLYLLSDFEDFIDPKAASGVGKKFARKKVKVFAQAYKDQSGFIGAIQESILRPTGGGQLLSVESMLSRP